LRRIAQRLRRSPGQIDSLELSLREESKVATVGRPERKRSIRCAGERVVLNRIESMDPEKRFAPWSTAGVSEPSAVRRHRDLPIRTVGSRNAESNEGTFDLRTRAAQKEQECNHQQRNRDRRPRPFCGSPAADWVGGRWIRFSQ